jgi:ADP-ribose pyrophosphatase YjhB (NUDIX family)
MRKELAMHIKVIVNLLLLSDEGKIAFVRYRSAPDNQSGVMLPSAIVEPGASIAGVPGEIMREQLGLELIPVKIADVDSFVGNDGSWHLAVTYKVKVPAANFDPPDFVDEACWLSPPAYENRTLAHSGWTRAIIKRCMDGD